MLLFKVQKSLFTDAVRRIQPALVKTKNPADIGQYLVLKLDSKKSLLTMIVNDQEVTVRITIDKAGDLLKISGDGVFVLRGETLYELLNRSNILDEITFNFEAKKDVLKPDDPSQPPISLLGNIDILFPGDEVWSIPVVDTATISVPVNPTIESKGDDHFKVNAQEFGKYITQVAMAVGPDNLDARFRNVLIRTVGNRFEIVSTTGTNMAWARALCKEMSGEFSMTIPHKQTMLISKIASPELDLVLLHTKGTPGSSVCSQEFLYGEKEIGTLQVKATCSPEPFAKFEKHIKSLSFVSSLKIKTQQLKPVCARMDLFSNPRTTVVIDSKKSTMSFSKIEDGRAKVKNITIPFSDLQGEPVNLEISSRYMLLAVTNAEAETIEWKFTGNKSLTCMILSDNLETYFSPFNED